MNQVHEGSVVGAPETPPTSHIATTVATVLERIRQASETPEPVLPKRIFMAAKACLEKGEYSKALEYFVRLAAVGSDAGYFGMAILYNNGLWVPQDIPAAVVFHRKAIEMGRIYTQH